MVAASLVDATGGTGRDSWQYLRWRIAQGHVSLDEIGDVAQGGRVACAQSSSADRLECGSLLPLFCRELARGVGAA